MLELERPLFVSSLSGELSNPMVSVTKLTTSQVTLSSLFCSLLILTSGCYLLSTFLARTSYSCLLVTVVCDVWTKLNNGSLGRGGGALVGGMCSPCWMKHLQRMKAKRQQRRRWCMHD